MQRGWVAAAGLSAVLAGWPTPGLAQGDVCATAHEQVQQFVGPTGLSVMDFLIGVRTIETSEGRSWEITGWSHPTRVRPCLVTFEYRAGGENVRLRWLADPRDGSVRPGDQRSADQSGLDR
jgi:hypothetical protein